MQDQKPVLLPPIDITAHINPPPPTPLPPLTIIPVISWDSRLDGYITDLESFSEQLKKLQAEQKPIAAIVFTASRFKDISGAYEVLIANIETQVEESLRAGGLLDDAETISGLEAQRLAIQTELDKTLAAYQADLAVAIAQFGADPFGKEVKPLAIAPWAPKRNFGDFKEVAQRLIDAYGKAHQAHLNEARSTVLRQRVVLLDQRIQALQQAQQSENAAAQTLPSPEAPEPSTPESTESASPNATPNGPPQPESPVEPSSPISKGPDFRLPGGTRTSSIALVTPVGVLAGVDAATTTLQGALRAVLASLAESTVAAGSRLLPALSLLVYSPKAGREQEFASDYALSTPLNELSDISAAELLALAELGSSLRLPYRFANLPYEQSGTYVRAVKTDLNSANSEVRVLAARFDPDRNVYSVQFPGDAGAHLTWTPIAGNLDPSTSLPEAPPVDTLYEGATLTPAEGRIDSVPAEDALTYNDFIAVFPIDSGMDPVYIMLRDPRSEPGVATGLGAPISGQWLGASDSRLGAPIPDRIAVQMSGKTFRDWRAFREEFWKLVGSDEALRSQFNTLNIRRMQENGFAPRAPEREAQGRNLSFHLHHVVPINQGGQVYDIDNLRVVTPKEHTEIHSKSKEAENA